MRYGHLPSVSPGHTTFALFSPSEREDMHAFHAAVIQACPAVKAKVTGDGSIAFAVPTGPLVPVVEAFTNGYRTGLTACQRAMKRNGWQDRYYPVKGRYPEPPEPGTSPTDPIDFLVVPVVRAMNVQDPDERNVGRKKAYGITFAHALAPYTNELVKLSDIVDRMMRRHGVCSRVFVRKYDKYAELVGVPSQEMQEAIDRYGHRDGSFGFLTKKLGGTETLTLAYAALNAGYHVGYEEGRQGKPRAQGGYQQPFPGPTHGRYW